jgi:RNA polymerase sigma-70 factor (ECF subfamily)
MLDKRTNPEWLQDLNSSGMSRDAAIADLREILLRATLYFFSRNLGDFGGLSHDEILQRAEDSTQEALIAVMNHLQEFRGDSKFSTWVYKFAINMALKAARRERWRGVSLDELYDTEAGAFSEWLMWGESGGTAPEKSAVQDELREIIRNVIENDLTDKQRYVLLLIVFKEIPMDEVVRHLGSNRNAVYKLLHDARRKLKSSLQARGFEVGEVLALFGGMG